MSNDSRNPFYPATRRDVALLKQTATDAVNDLGSTAAVHASKARNHLRDLAEDFKTEGSEYLEQTHGKLRDLTDSIRGYASAHPFVCMGAALAIGFLFGLSRRTTPKE